MSTRATYEIAGAMFYVHHDGYAKGAANYFAKMVEAMTVPANGRGIDCVDDRRGGPAFAFIRGNMNAEPTESHDVHGDTEYRWKLEEKAGELVVSFQARAHGEPGYRWSAWSEATPVATFINRQWPGRVVVAEDPSPYYQRTMIATTPNALAIAAEYRTKGRGFAEGNPNRASYLARADAWERAALEQIPARCSYLERLVAECREELAADRSSYGRAYYTHEIAEAELELAILREPIAA